MERQIIEHNRVNENKEAKVIVYINDAKCTAQMFLGRKKKAKFHYKFQSTERLEVYVADEMKYILDQFNRVQAWKNKEKNEKVEGLKNIKVGDIFNATWGYEQTNQDFYQVVGIKTKSNKTLVIRELKVNREYTSDMSGNVTPTKDDFYSEPREIKFDGKYIKINSFSKATLWDGTSRYFSTYA